MALTQPPHRLAQDAMPRSDAHSGANSGPHSGQKFPDQRWQIAPAQADLAEDIAQATHLSLLLAQVLVNRGLTTADRAIAFLHPDQAELPSPLEDFPDLPLCLELLIDAINQRQKIAICGDYDADGMTSTALLLRSLRALGAQVEFAIPSRMHEGYGINTRIIEEFYDDGITVVLTVDNGITAVAPIARARELGLTVIITDHHAIPDELPPANAILNPQLIAPESPYRGLAGVGVAYVLATCLAEALGRGQDLGPSLLELFTLGTIADLAPLTGVNRRWVRRGLQLLPKSKIEGIAALIQVAGLSGAKDLKPEAIGFRLGPRINAVGRLADPQIVIELLTTTDLGVALERAMQCEQINQQRQKLCEEIEQAAIALCEAGEFGDPQAERVLVVVQPDWHHGVIGIVASRLVERYGVPVFIGTYEDEEQTQIRGSARSIPEFHIFEALQHCEAVLGKFGGHRAAGGFSLPAENLAAFRSHLRDFAHGCLQPEHLKPLVLVDAQAPLEAVNHALYAQIDALHPCGIANPDPVFWAANVWIHEQRAIGKGHLKLTVSQDDPSQTIQAIAWRWGEYFPLPQPVDIAFRVRLNEWQGTISVELEMVGVRRSSPPTAPLAEFSLGDRHYRCCLVEKSPRPTLQIENDEGSVLVVQQGQKLGILNKSRRGATVVNVCQPPFYDLVKAAVQAVNVPAPGPSP
jgi:single-stranded-DNA-specific exonuclease